MKLTDELDAALRQIKAIILENVIMLYPDHNNPFEIRIDASDYQLGACSMQGGKLVTYYFQKLRSAQKNSMTFDWTNKIHL